jgi:hypothetical protein
MAFTERLQDFFAVEDFAIVALWTPSAGGAQQSANVIYDSPDQGIWGDTVMTTEYAITMRAADFPGLKGGETIIAAGATFKVRELRLLDDGALKRATLSKV